MVLVAVSAVQPFLVPGGKLVVILACLLTGLVLVRCRWRPGRVAGVAAVLIAVQVAAAAVTGVSWVSSAPWIAGGAVMALCLLLPVLVATATRRRREYAEAGWQLAEATDRLRAVEVDRAVAEERAAMAAEIHDALGHRITLIAVQAGRLSLDPVLTDDARDGLRAIRRAAADATAELGETVDLLGGPGGSPPSGIDGFTIDDLLVGARSAGLEVTVDIDAGLMCRLSEDARAAALRVLREGLTNALRHASAPQARVTAHRRDDDDVLVRIDNPTGTGPSAAGTGRGLKGLRYRIDLLGGSLTTSVHDGTFCLEASLPADARRGAPSGLVTPAVGVDERRYTGARRHERAHRAALWVPVGVVAATLALLAAVFVAVTVLSVLPRADVDRIRVGQARAEAERILPPVEMLDAPRDALPTPRGAECRHYEVSVSFFARDDVHRVCFAAGRVIAVEEVPAP